MTLSTEPLKALSAIDRSEPRMTRFTWHEIARHASPSDCWIVIRGRVYDVSNFAATHPGGRIVYAFAGRDATDVFTTFHGPAAWRELAARCIGELESIALPSPLIEEFRRLRATFHREGHFKSKKSYYAFKIVGNFAILALSIALLVNAHGSWPWVVLSAVILGVFWQQSGWLAHDFCHHQVFENRIWNDATSYLLGNISQGFSVDWWKTKHNLHHAAPNELTHDKRAVDPDIDTLPLLAWSSEMLSAIADAKHLRFVRFQPFLFFPILLMARFNWAMGSLAHAVRLAKQTRRGKGELALLALHYAWHFGLAFAFLPIPIAIGYAVLSQVVSGGLLAIVFVQSHNGMEVFSSPKDFVSSQVASTRDIKSSLWNDWFTGGLNYQIEHHLFPTIPRHNLHKLRAPLRALCEKHGLAFEETSMADGTARVLRRLVEVAGDARTYMSGREEHLSRR
jgi:acyl-lipid Delta6-acetylenase / acyl-lipid (9-3)-desaturase